jgi:hypothetical protein
MSISRPIFVLRVRPEPRVDDPIRALRGGLKVLLRRYGLRCLSICEQHQTTDATSPAPRDSDGDIEEEEISK